MRPQYETCGDLGRERQVIRVLKDRGYLKACKKLSREERIDYRALTARGNKIYLEVKCRTCMKHDYRTWFVSATKVRAAEDYLYVTGEYTWFAVRWADELGLVRFDKGEKVSFGGRTDRGDPMDVEEMVHFPVESFYRVRMT